MSISNRENCYVTLNLVLIRIIYLYLRLLITVLFIKGYETTVFTLNYALFLLAANPGAQLKVQQELDQVFGTGDDVTLVHLAELKYLEMCIKETLRLYPSGPVISRSASEDIPLGNSCSTCYYFLVLFF